MSLYGRVWSRTHAIYERTQNDVLHFNSHRKQAHKKKNKNKSKKPTVIEYQMSLFSRKSLVLPLPRPCLRLDVRADPFFALLLRAKSFKQWTSWSEWAVRAESGSTQRVHYSRIKKKPNQHIVGAHSDFHHYNRFAEIFIFIICAVAFFFLTGSLLFRHRSSYIFTCITWNGMRIRRSTMKQQKNWNITTTNFQLIHVI